MTADMQTHKNPTLRQGPAPFKAPSTAGDGPGRPAPVADKPPSFVRDGKKWLIVSTVLFCSLFFGRKICTTKLITFKCYLFTGVPKRQSQSTGR